MISKLRPLIILINVILIIVVVGMQVISKEKLKNNGDLYLFKLAPVDPRSLMQGDYMELRYQITRAKKIKEIPARGYLIFKPDDNLVAQYIRHQKRREPINEGEKCIKYFCHRWDVSIGVESFFFQEGYAEVFAEAKYGALRINDKGDKVLVGLYDEELEKIKP